MTKQHKCPQCKGPLQPVQQSSNSPLNKYQFDATKAGDWYCPTCPSNDRGQQPLCYWWQHELPDAIEYNI